NSGTIKDAAGNVATLTLPEPSALNSLKANRTLVVDGILPVFSTQTAIAGTKTITLTTSETVSSTLIASDFAVSINNVSSTVSSVALNGTTVTLTLADYIPNSAAVTVDYTQGTNKITDVASNALASIGDPLAVTVTNDSIVPTVQSVSSTEDAKTYKVGVVIPITVKFSESVFVTGTPLLALETGNLDRTATFDKISESDNKTLIFNYTVQSGDNSADLAYTTSNALSLNSGTIKDAAGNVATLTLPEPALTNSLKANKNLVVDGILPVFLNASGLTSPFNGKTLTKTNYEFKITLDFSEDIKPISAGDTWKDKISIQAPTGSGLTADKLVKFTANIVDNNVVITLDNSDPDISNPRNQLVEVDVAANTFQDFAGNVLPEIVGVNSYNIMLNI
ncbi:SwmB domain-containing protein, partial [Chromatium okenii]|uniref:SwmB domain-containing protein n=1 Tax=Chromatium okenii TaxID=61644 RepID=UPI0026E9878E